MDTTALVLDTRKSEDIYKQALKLAKHYCPEWAKNWEDDHFDPDDPGLVIFKLFSNMTEYYIKQFNRIPEKQYMVFLDFMGIDVRSARPSLVPLTFYLAQGSSVAQIPSGTLVASSEDPEIVFETSQHLTAIDLKLNAFSINSPDDRYTDHSGALSQEKTFLIFSGDKDEKPQDHIFYLGDDDIFNGKIPFGKLRIKFTGYDLSPKYFERWFNGAGLPVDVEISREQDNDQSLIFDLKNMEEFEKNTFNDIQTYWFFIRPDKKIRIIHGGKLPRISTVTADIISGNIIPDILFFDNISLDIKKGIYPFGETPNIGSSFYIGSVEALSKENSTIILNIELEKELENYAVELLWEFWDGAAWHTLPIKQDDTDGFRKSGKCKIEFICPDIPECEINEQPNRWIRVKIRSGGYGNAGKMEQIPVDDLINSLPESVKRKDLKSELEKKNISFGIQYIPPDYDPPFIKSLDFVYIYRDRKIKQVMSYANFSYIQFKDTDSIVPYEPFPIDHPVFYLGFEKIEANIQLSLYFSIKEKISEKLNNIWKYYDGTIWKELSLENDETGSFNKSGIISFLFPPDIVKSVEFGKELFWVRIETKNPLPSSEINGIFPNTVWAVNHFTVQNEVLGSGNGIPGQSVSFARKPVLPGQVIEIKDRDTSEKWMETNSFALSGKLSRHYIIDRKNGRIFFGDGIHGMVPPKGKNNIIAKFYRSGGGVRGNQEKGLINTLRKANPDIESVINQVPSSGGVDTENDESAVFRGPHTIKNRGYAVTIEDFEWLAMEASPEIIKTKAIIDDKNKIKIIILADRKSPTPLPEKNLMDSVEKYIKERVFFNIREEINILWPEYKRIDSKVTFKPLYVNESSIVIEKVKMKMRTFLDPVRGGKFGKGFDFGEKIYVSGIAAAIEDVEGVDYVEKIILKKINNGNVAGEVSAGGWLIMENNALPYAGDIEVKIAK